MGICATCNRILACARFTFYDMLLNVLLNYDNCNKKVYYYQLGFVNLSLGELDFPINLSNTWNYKSY